VVLSLINANPFYQLSIIAACALLALAAGVSLRGRRGGSCACSWPHGSHHQPAGLPGGTTVIWSGPVLPVLGRMDITLEAVAIRGGDGPEAGGGSLVVRAAVSRHGSGSGARAAERDGSRSALLSALSLRMVPTAMRDSTDILDAQRARGIARDSGGRWRVFKSRLPLVGRLVTASLDRAIGLAEARRPGPTAPAGARDTTPDRFLGGRHGDRPAHARGARAHE